VLGSRSSSESKVEGDSSPDAQTGVGGVAGSEGALREVFLEKGLAEDDVGGWLDLDVDGLGMDGVGREVNVVPHRIEDEALKVELLCGSRP